MTEATPGVRAILVTDFDGTLTGRDFFQIALDHLLPRNLPDYWGDYLSGRRTHFETLQLIYAAITATEQDVLDVLPLTQLEPQLAKLIPRLRQAGWNVVVASAGCRWYIERLLASQGVVLEIHSNPGRFTLDQGLRMELPVDSRFYSPTHGIDKAAVVRHALDSGLPVAFAGDGYPDLEAARLVPAKLRFARGALAESLGRLELPFQPFEQWSQVANQLLGTAYAGYSE
jgi:2-hydroxy-3-keto-5-methylthiopentenyl-1-phosphate phosphatase